MEISLYEVLLVSSRAIISLIVLFLVTRLLGKKQVSQLSVFDYVIGISIGNFAAEITINLEAKLIYGIISVLIFGFIAYLISILTMKSIKLRRFFMGVPTVLIDQGEIIETGLKKVHFDINDLLEECRSNGYFDVNEIEYAIMECNGQVSFMPKNKPITVKDLDIREDKSSLCANIIIDGNIMENNLVNMNKDYRWLNKELKIKGIKVDDILLATLDCNDKLTIYEKNTKKVKNVLE